MCNIEKYDFFKPKGKDKYKKQIILCHTSRDVEEYLTSLKFRYNKKYSRIPNFLLTKTGKILQLLPDYGFSDFTHDENINKSSIIIMLENLGWLEKKPLSNQYINWKGNIYIGEVYEKKWRDFFFWEPYGEKQIVALGELCNYLFETYKIKRSCIGHNTKVEGVKNFEGVISRSNMNSRFTDLNPSFDFELFLKLIQNEEYSQ